MALKRCFEFRKGTSEKFWHIEVSAATETVHYGRIGTTGQTKSKTFPNHEAAATSFEKRIAEKLKKGYVEIGGAEALVQLEGYGSWTSATSWKKLFGETSLRPFGRPSALEWIDQFEADWDFRFPKSFRKYLEVFGAGEFNNFFKFHAPGGPEHFSLETLNNSVERDYDFVQEEYARLEPVSRMIFFCSDFGAYLFGWDPEDLRDAKNREYGVYEWGHGHQYVEEVASSFPEFLIEELLNDRRGQFTDDEGDYDESDRTPTFLPAELTSRTKKTGKRKPKKKASSKSSGPVKGSSKKTGVAAKSKKKRAPKKKPAREERAWLLRLLHEQDSEPLWNEYAQWLDAYNDPEAELVRVRLNLRRAKPGTSEFAELEARESELLSGQASEWLESRRSRRLIVPILHRLGSDIEFDDEGEPTNITLVGEQISPTSINKLTSLKRLSVVYLREHPLSTEELKAIGDFTNLQRLLLRDAKLTDEDLRTIGAQKNLRSLRELDLRYNRISGDGFAYLKNFTNLEALYLRSMNFDGKTRFGISPKGIAAIGKLKTLKTLNMPYCEIPSGSLRFLASLPKLERLDLAFNDNIGDDDLTSLKSLLELRSLDLGSRNLDSVSISGRGLASICQLTKLENLVFRGADVGDEGVVHLKDLTNLRFLELPAFGEVRITNAGAAYLKKLVRLERLDLSGNDIMGDGLKFIARMKQLRKLKLDENAGVDDDSLKHLKSLKKLEELYLTSTGISDAGTTYLEDFPRLSHLQFHHTKVSSRRHKELKKIYPQATVWWSAPWA